MSESHHPNYKKIYFILLGLLVVSVVGPFAEILWLTLITAFGIALVKANLVIQNFMHLKWERDIIKWMLTTSLVLMFILFAGVAPDVMNHTGTRWVNDGALAATARGIETHDDEGDHAVAEGETEGEPAAAAAPVQQAFDAAASYAVVCTTCHGPAGAGDGPGGAVMNPPPANFTLASFWEERSDDVVKRAILEGGMAVGKSALMPAWGSIYSEEQADQMVEYLKTFQGS